MLPPDLLLLHAKLGALQAIAQNWLKAALSAAQLYQTECLGGNY
jgi:hypothetical protein